MLTFGFITNIKYFLKMKKILLFSFVLFAINIVSAQRVRSSKVPTAVKTAFAKAQPSTKKVSWSKEDANFEASFDNTQGKDMSVVITPTGDVVETELEIAFSELPQAAQMALKGKKVKETAKITDAKGNVKFEAEVAGKDLLFDVNGKAM